MSTEVKVSPMSKLTTAQLEKRANDPKISDEIRKEAKDLLKKRSAKKAAPAAKKGPVPKITTEEGGIVVNTKKVKQPAEKKEKVVKASRVPGPKVSFLQYRTANEVSGNCVADRNGNASVRIGTDWKPYILLAVDGTYRWKQLEAVTFEDPAQKEAAEKIGKKVYKAYAEANPDLVPKPKAPKIPKEPKTKKTKVVAAPEEADDLI